MTQSRQRKYIKNKGECRKWGTGRQYDEEFKKQAILLSKEIGNAAAAKELMPLGLAIEDNMRASLCCHTLENAKKAYPDIIGCIIHSDRGSQYTSTEYRTEIKKYGIIQSMNSAGGRCHDNARCESMWARMKEELFYSRNDKSENYTMAELKTKIWRYFMSYWANRRICTANAGLPPAVKRTLYYGSASTAA